ncbi:PIN domain-containing protein [Halorussus salilacus]|uniref:PIN domain-containing protein n=1 Tax=Halorussus salilacus TaxID=2953750 RepID=UPI00209D4FDD|nr:PIN domain-containing protein [Halorussus salilacus]USZ68620.1 PIN domain-containing protein [Halorussus salilacus]
MILDTSFLLDLKDGKQDAFEKATELYDSGVVQRVAIPSVMELQYVASIVQSDDEQRRVRNLLQMYPLVPVDKRTALRAGALLAEADRRYGGTSGVDNPDALIGAVAERFGEPVLTDNVDDFARLPGIEVETY